MKRQLLNGMVGLGAGLLTLHGGVALAQGCIFGAGSSQPSVRVDDPNIVAWAANRQAGDLDYQPGPGVDPGWDVPQAAVGPADSIGSVEQSFRGRHLPEVKEIKEGTGRSRRIVVFLMWTTT